MHLKGHHKIRQVGEFYGPKTLIIGAFKVPKTFQSGQRNLGPKNAPIWGIFGS